jgi:hypothetical protein
MPPLPWAAAEPGAFGHCSVVFAGYFVPHPVGSAAARYDVKRNVSPELSERWIAATGVEGIVTPGFKAVI